MDRRSLLKLVAVSPFLPATVRRAAIGSILRPTNEDKCRHRNTKTVTQDEMDEDMRRRGDIVCSGEMVFCTPGTYCLDCQMRLSD